MAGRSVPAGVTSTLTVAMSLAVPARVSSAVTAASVTVPRAEAPAFGGVRPSASRSGPVEAARQARMPASARCRVEASSVVRTATPSRPSVSAWSRCRP
ncbi:hypothetical protein SGLAM104S_05546 [Streptomyces glaucescens]